MIYNMDAFHTVKLVSVLEEAYHIVDLFAKNIKYYKLKEEIEQWLKLEKELSKRKKLNQSRRSSIRNIMISLQADKHYKINSIIHLMKELMILWTSFQIKHCPHQSLLIFIRSIKLERRKLATLKYWQINKNER